MREIEALSTKSELIPAESSSIPSRANGVYDPAPRRLARWASLFADELAEVHTSATARRTLGDLGLRQTLSGAAHLLATVYDRSVADFQLDE